MMSIRDCYKTNFPNSGDIFEISMTTGIITKKTIPNFIKCVKIIDDYQHIIEPDVLPSELIELDLGFWYNKKLKKGSLPNNLVYLKMSNLYKHKFDENTFPPNLIYLELPFCYGYTINGNILPNSIKYLHLPGQRINIIPQPLPLNLTHLYLGQNGNYNLKNIILPPTLYLISFNGGTNCDLKHSFYPKTLKVMKFKSNTKGQNNDKILSNIPLTVEILIFDYLLGIITNLPSTIKKIKISFNYSKNEIIKCIPKIPFGCIIVDSNDKVIIDDNN